MSPLPDAQPRIPGIEWAVRGRAIRGESVSGDLHVIAPRSEGALVGVADGLGHGPDAAVAAQKAVAFVEANANLDLDMLFSRCHAELKPTRGVVLSLAALDTRRNTMIWAGVGNVAAALVPKNASLSQREALVTSSGVLGYRLPTLRKVEVPIQRDDLLIITTDGVATDPHLDHSGESRTEEIAARILERHGAKDDDALVLVVRYLGRDS